MPFSETIKEKVKERAHFRCCICHEQLATCIHHIEPEGKGGLSTEDNAAPLCPTCHFEYGNNPDMRSFIRQSRDAWYKRCDMKSTPDFEMIHKTYEYLRKEVVTKTDLDNALRPIYDVMLNPDLPASKRIQVVSDISTAISDVVVARVSDTLGIAEAVVVQHLTPCSKCGTNYPTLEDTCPACGAPRDRGRDCTQ